MKLPESFYIRSNVTVIARQLLGKILVTRINGKVTSGIIVETEAYSDRERGSHAFRGMTKRNEVMFGRGGKAYVYLCYGVHEMFNVVTNNKGKADAILIRALEPLEGIETMQERMNKTSPSRITSGPGKLAKALGIDRKLNGEKLGTSKIWIEDKGLKIKPSDIVSSPRIGIDYAGDDALLPWRFTIQNNKWISK
ncbi:MAG TPA: DNA-3-methyladenine glycosylase [Cyclobacteriaceae bacterium]|jgi:DNA-3-methyladenine glycosylase|nr:DNA-3-methyladenine glycosylase [Cyclobacteriaceae bacterium]